MESGKLFHNAHSGQLESTLRTASRCDQCDSAAFTYDPHRVFAGILPLAFVSNELFLDVGVCILRSADSLGICRELDITIFTHAKHRNIILSFDDPKLALHSSDTDGHCSASIARRSLTVMELLNFA
jgi:hypothetical protein